jgi:hypothetical protein
MTATVESTRARRSFRPLASVTIGVLVYASLPWLHARGMDFLDWCGDALPFVTVCGLLGGVVLFVFWPDRDRFARRSGVSRPDLPRGSGFPRSADGPVQTRRQPPTRPTRARAIGDTRRRPSNSRQDFWL